MFCERCGTKIPDGQTQCPNCAPAQQPGPAYQQPVNYQQPNAYQQPVNYQQPNAYQPNPYQSNPYQSNPYGQPPRRRKAKKSNNKMMLFIVAGVAVVLLAVILGIVLSGVFASPEGRLEKMEKANAKVITEVVAESYGTYLESVQDSLKGMEKGTSTKTDIKITANNSMLTSLMASLMGGDMNSVNMSWLNNIMISLDVDAKGNQFAVNCGVGVNDKVLASIGAIADGNQNKMYMNAPELNANYLYADLDMMDIDLQSMYDMVEPTRKLAEDLPSEKEVKKMVGTYLDIVFSYVEEVEKIEETVYVAGESKEMTVLKAKITAPKLMQMIMELAETAQEDKTLQKLVNAVETYYLSIEAMQYGYYGGQPSAYEDLMHELQDLVEEMNEEAQYVGEENYIMLSNYVSSGMIVGRRAEIFTNGMYEDELCYYMFLPTKDGGYFEANMEEVQIYADVNDDTVAVDLLAEGMNVASVILEDFEMKAGVPNGTMTIIPSSMLLDELDVPASFYGYQQIGLEMTFDGDLKSGTTQVALLIGGQSMVDVSISVKEDKFNKITVPTSATSLESEYDMMAWVSGIKFDTVIKNMQSAKVPNEYVQLVQQLESMLKMQSMYP